MNELNNKITSLFSEISNKDKIITKLNNEHAEISKQINDYINWKNEDMAKIAEKEEEINKLQQNIYEINNKLLEKNQEINQIFNEKQGKDEEMNKLNKELNENKKKVEENNNIIKALNNKLRIIEELNKKGLARNNYFNNNTSSLNNNFANEKSLNGMISINSFNNESGIDSQNVIEKLKKRNEKLIKDKIIYQNEIYQLNVKYAISEYLSKLFFKLLQEFNDYQMKNNTQKDDDKTSMILNEIFIKDKISQCNEDMKNLEEELNINAANKSKVINDILSDMSLYIDSYNSSNDNFINNCKNYQSILEKEEKDYKIQDILDELFYSINQLNLNNIPITNIIDDIINLFNGISKSLTNKSNSVENLIKKIDESYKDNVITEELICNENIIYYQNKNISDSDIKNKEQNGEVKLLQNYNEYNKNITNTKNKYIEIINKFYLYKNYIDNKKNDIEKNILLFKNIEKNDREEIKKEGNEEINYEMKLIMNKIENNKNLLQQIINKLNDEININNINIKECLESIPNNSLLKEKIEKNLNIKNEIEDKIEELEANYLLMKNLPSNYESYQKYLSISVLERKNKILEEKLKIIFGSKFNINNIYNVGVKPEIIWNKNEIPKLMSEIMILKENKNLLEKDYNTLQIAFNLALKGKEGINDNQLIILFKIKEENKQLKKELRKIKEKNNLLQERIRKINKDNANKILIGNEAYETTNNNYMHTLVDCSISEIKDNNVVIPNLKKKINYNDAKENNSILNDISNGFTPKRKKKKFLSCEKSNNK